MFWKRRAGPPGFASFRFADAIGDFCDFQDGVGFGLDAL
jgi:hypothetical protein